MRKEQQRFDEPERAHKPKREGRLWGIGMVVLAIPVIAVFGFFFLAPVFGFAAIADGGWYGAAAPDPDPEQAIPVSSVFYMVVSLALVVAVVAWLVRGRRPSGVYQTYAVLALILGVATAFTVAVKGQEDSVDNWQLWIIPIAAAAVFGAVFAILLLITRLRAAVRAEANTNDANAQ